jgi:glycosyltransferase involved in cell wall biosynthesis
MKPDLFVGVTTWNSGLFLENCLRSIHKTTCGLHVRIGVADNVSTDRSVEIARDMGAEVWVGHSSQAIALNRLLSMSDARYTLLMHSDVILLSSDWYPTCAARLTGSVALVSPEDIGCGPLTRPYGAGKPESCFLLFDTKKAGRARIWKWIRRRGIPYPIRHLDLEDYYITHDLPTTLGLRGYTWCPMKVHPSPKEPSPVYSPPFTPEYWSDELSFLRYGMGNFYSLDGRITHYHNWYDRVSKDVPITSLQTTEGSGKGLPLAFLSLGTRRFMEDLKSDQLVLPDPDVPQPEPCVTPRHTPDLSRPFALRELPQEEPIRKETASYNPLPESDPGG